jgi:hypothetical protein
MSLEARMDRSVYVEATTLMEVEDEYGNRLEHAQRFGPFPALRNQSGATEDQAARDSQVQTFDYILSPSVKVSGYDRIIDGSDTFEVIGTPEVVRGQVGPHHVQLKVRIIRG